jgi:CubicO group peptidase (beta-lactamase class C family)
MKSTSLKSNAIKSYFAMAFLLMPLSFLFVGGTIQKKSFIEKLAAEYVSDDANNALVIGIIRNGKQEVFTFGETERGNHKKPNANAIFELGTTSEVFTTSLLALLESEGKISSLEGVQDVLKGKMTIPFYQRIVCKPRPITDRDSYRFKTNSCYPDPQDAPQMMVLCDLATHSAGLPTTPFADIFDPKNSFSTYSLDSLNRDVSELPTNQAFGYQYNYSMLGMGLLGEAMGIKTKKDYETLLKETILGPLSMTHTFTTPTGEQAALFLNGHNSKGKAVNHRNYNALTPAAGIRSSVPDLLTFLNANLTPTTKFNIALGETHIPRLFTDHTNKDYMIGWGWISKPMSDKSKKRLYWQCGEQGGFATFMGFNKESNIGVVILSNSANRTDDTGFKILEYLENAPKTAFKD